MNELFKGYVLTKGKRPIDTFKNGKNLRTLKEVEGYTEYAGILNDHAILIDIDDYEQSEILFRIVQDLNVNCLVIKTTRGKHFYFKNHEIPKCSTHSTLACGLTGDIKVKNNPGVLKIDGKLREVIYDASNYDDIPFWLYPIKTRKNLVGLEEEDGRNSDLYGYILTLQHNNFSTEQIRETIKIINKYVFKEPLEEKELETILRDEAFEKPNFYENGKLDVNGFARFLIINEHICKINNQIYIFNGEVYINGSLAVEKAMIKYIPNLLRSKRSEVLDMINILLEEKDNKKYAKPNYIAFRNGIYDLNTDKLLDFSPDIVITNQIPWNYNPNANNQEITQILNNWVGNDEKTRLLLEEGIGMCMYRSNKISSCFMLTGEKDNGKSTFINLLKALLGLNNVSSVSLHNLEKRFYPAAIVGKLANLGDDIGNEYITKTENFKKLVTGDTIQMENKGKTPFDYDNYGKLIFNANETPRIYDPTGAVVDKRIIMIPFDMTYTKINKDPELSNKFSENQDMMETLILIGIAGIKRVLKNKGFTESEKSNLCKADYKLKNDPIEQFLQEHDRSEFINEPVDKFHSEYRIYCETNHFNWVNSTKFYQTVCKKLDLETERKSLRENSRFKKIRIFVDKN